MTFSLFDFKKYSFYGLLNPVSIHFKIVLNNKLNGCSLEQEGEDFYIVGADSVRKKLGNIDASKIKMVEKSISITGGGTLTATVTPSEDCTICVSFVCGGASDSMTGTNVTGSYQTVDASAGIYKVKANTIFGASLSYRHGGTAWGIAHIRIFIIPD